MDNLADDTTHTTDMFIAVKDSQWKDKPIVEYIKLASMSVIESRTAKSAQAEALTSLIYFFIEEFGIFK